MAYDTSSLKNKPVRTIIPRHNFSSSLVFDEIFRQQLPSSLPESNLPTKMIGASSSIYLNICYPPVNSLLLFTPHPSQTLSGMSMCRTRHMTTAKVTRVLFSPLVRERLQAPQLNIKYLPKVQQKVKSSDSTTNPVMSFGLDTFLKHKVTPFQPTPSTKTKRAPFCSQRMATFPAPNDLNTS